MSVAYVIYTKYLNYTFTPVKVVNLFIIHKKINGFHLVKPNFESIKGYGVKFLIRIKITVQVFILIDF